MWLDDRLPGRFWVKTTRSEDCWLWTATTDEGGYGRFWNIETKKLNGAHRFAYEALVGPIPEGLHLDHLCRVRNCVNPAHLEPVTPKENILRGVGTGARHARQTHCARGHEYTPETTHLAPQGWRVCIPCRRENSRAYKARLKLDNLNAEVDA